MRYSINDAFVEKLLSDLVHWSINPSNPFPSVAIPYEERVEIESHRIASREALLRLILNLRNEKGREPSLEDVKAVKKKAKKLFGKFGS